jgi:hypothetical protein
MRRIDPLQNPLRPAYFMNYAEDETPAEMVLRKLACWLGVCGYNAPRVDAEEFHRKIVDGILMMREPPQPQRAPLSDEQILKAAGRLPGFLRHHEELDCEDLIDFGRAIERAHGIGGQA